MSYFKPSLIKEIASKIKQNNVGIFPCDTIHGLIARIHKSTIQRLYTIKERKNTCPFLILIPNLTHLEKWTKEIT